MANVECVILAAGYSSRADAFKPELDLNGKSLLERCMETFYDICSRIVVVGGYQIEKVARIAEKYPKVQVVCNERYPEGMFTSVKEGLRHTGGGRVFITPCDCPLVSAGTCRAMLNVEGDIVIPAFHGKTGHPVLLDKSVIKEILAEPDSSNLRDFIRRKGFLTVEAGDAGILEDMDTPKDYRRILKKFKEGGGRFDR